MTLLKELAVCEVRRWTVTGSVVVLGGSNDMMYRDSSAINNLWVDRLYGSTRPLLTGSERVLVDRWIGG